MATLYPFSNRLLYIHFVLGRTKSIKKNHTPTVVSTMRTANLCDLAWGKYQATGKNLSAVTQLRLSTVSPRC
jgi:hypothetical protein